MTRPDSKSYQTLPFNEQAAVVLTFMADSGHKINEAEKFAADCSGDRGRALQRARVTGTAWKTASVIPTAIRRDYPRLVAFAAMEDAFIAADKAAVAVRAANAME
jgi:hypothetical protein